MRKLLCLFLLVVLSASAQTFTEFYCQTTGSNLNAGSTTNDADLFSYAGGTFVRATCVFTVGSGNPQSDGVTNGAWASIYTTAGATVCTCVGRVTNVTTTTITIDTNSISGSAGNVSETAAASTCKIGGAWKGPNGTQKIPFNFLQNNSTNLAGNPPRANLKNGVNYTVGNSTSIAPSGPMRFQGYTTTPGDGGKFVIDGGSPGTSINILLFNGAAVELYDAIIQNNGTSAGTAVCVGTGTARNTLVRVVANNSYYSGISLGGNAIAIECEAYACNLANNASEGGIKCSGNNNVAVRCISHDNSGNANSGFVGPFAAMVNCVSDSNGKNGATLNAAQACTIVGCDFYNNTGDGIDMTVATHTAFDIENCNFIKNGGYGINSSGTQIRSGEIVNCGFGTGTVTNSSGNILPALLSGVQASVTESGSVLYAADTTPWSDPANGDFRVTLATAKAAGRGSFTETAASYSGTTASPSIGAGQPAATSGASGGSYTFAQ